MHWSKFLIIDDGDNRIVESSEDEEEQKAKEEEEKKKDTKTKKSTTSGLENGIKGVTKDTDAANERKKRLKTMGMDAFLFVIQKRNRLQDPKTPRNRWFRWKDRLVKTVFMLLFVHNKLQIAFSNKMIQFILILERILSKSQRKRING